MAFVRTGIQTTQKRKQLGGREGWGWSYMQISAELSWRQS